MCRIKTRMVEVVVEQSGGGDVDLALDDAGAGDDFGVHEERRQHLVLYEAIYH